MEVEEDTEVDQEAEEDTEEGTDQEEVLEVVEEDTEVGAHQVVPVLAEVLLEVVEEAEGTEGLLLEDHVQEEEEVVHTKRK